MGNRAFRAPEPNAGWTVAWGTSRSPIVGYKCLIRSGGISPKYEPRGDKTFSGVVQDDRNGAERVSAEELVTTCAFTVRPHRWSRGPRRMPRWGRWGEVLPDSLSSWRNLAMGQIG